MTRRTLATRRAPKIRNLPHEGEAEVPHEGEADWLNLPNEGEADGTGNLPNEGEALSISSYQGRQGRGFNDARVAASRSGHWLRQLEHGTNPSD